MPHSQSLYKKDPPAAGGENDLYGLNSLKPNKYIIQHNACLAQIVVGCIPCMLDQMYLVEIGHDDFFHYYLMGVLPVCETGA